MTEKELRELDARVHHEVMGGKVELSAKSMVVGGTMQYWTHFEPPPAYSTDIAMAWKVVEKLHPLGLVRVSNGDGDSFDFDFIPINPFMQLAPAHVSADSWPLAICLGAVSAVEPHP